MIRQTLLLFSLLIVLIIQGCTSFQYQTATPYHKKSEPRQVIEQSEIQGPTVRPATPPENPVVKDISNQANQLMRNGKLDAAAQTLERGLRIAPKEAFLWSQLATVRLRQGHYEQAQSLAAKSTSLAKGNAELIHKNHIIIEKARK